MRKVDVIRKITEIQKELKLTDEQPYYYYLEWLKIQVLLGDVKLWRRSEI